MNLFSTSQETGDSNAVVQAIMEQADTIDVGILGEPDVVNRGSDLSPDPKVVVPLRNSIPSGPNPADLEFDLPNGPGDERSEFFNLLDLYSIEKIADMSELEGKNVPLANISGVVIPDFEEVATEDVDE